MAKSYVQDGSVIDVTLAAAVSAGDVVVVGALVGVAITDGAVGDTIAVNINGVWQLPAAADDTYVQGETLAYDVSADVFTDFSGAGTQAAGDIVAAGVAFEDANAGGSVKVRLNVGGSSVA